MNIILENSNEKKRKYLTSLKKKITSILQIINIYRKESILTEIHKFKKD